MTSVEPIAVFVFGVSLTHVAIYEV